MSRFGPTRTSCEIRYRAAIRGTADSYAPWVRHQFMTARPGTLRPHHVCNGSVLSRLICPTNRFSEILSRPIAKTVSLYQKRESAVDFARPAPARGALRDRHRRWTRDAMAALARETNAPERTAKPCGPDPRRSDQVPDDDFRDDGGNQARSPRRVRNKP